MVSADKLIKVGVKYSDQYFEQLKALYIRAYANSMSFEEFLDETSDYSIGNPLEAGGFKDTLSDLIVSSTNDIRFSRPAQKALMQTIVRNTTGELIVNVGDDIKAGVRNIVGRGYRNGKLNHKRVADEITHELDGINHKRARTIARTEIKRAQTTSNYVVALERGANAYKYKCGAKPCDICKKDCGKTYPITDLEHLPPRHPSCMCGVSFFKDPNLPEVEKPTTTEPTETPTKETTSKLNLNERELKRYNRAKREIEKATKQLEKLPENDPRRLMYEARLKSARKTIKELETKSSKNLSRTKPKKPEYPLKLETNPEAINIKQKLGAKSVRSETHKTPGGFIRTYDIYEFDGYSVAMDRELMYSKNVPTVKEVRDHINSLPKPLKTGVRIDIINVWEPGVGGRYYSDGHHIEIYNNGHRVETTSEFIKDTKSTSLDVITHEVAHSYDLKNYDYLKTTGNIATKEVWGAICKEDDKLYKYRDERTGRMRTPRKFPTAYAGEAWYKASRSSILDNKARQYCEDFAESTKLYLNPLTHKEFVKQFPNRAEFLKEHYGKPDFKNYTVHKLTAVASNDTSKKTTGSKSKSTKTTITEPTAYQLNNKDNSYSNVIIEEKHLKEIIDFQLKRQKNKIEYGNCIFLDDATMYHQKDVRGKSNGVVCRRPNVKRDFAFVHNHPGSSNATFSGADMRNQLEFSGQKFAIATTPDGIWIARDTEYGTHSKNGMGITADNISHIMYGMNAKVNEFAKSIYEEKYKTLLENATDKKEFNKLQEEYRKEYIAQYNDWVLETYGVGKNKYNYFEIEFISNEELKNVQF